MVSEHQTPERAARFVVATNAVMDRIVSVHSNKDIATVESMDRMVRHIEIMLRDDWIKAAAGSAIVESWAQAVAMGKQWIEDNL